MSKQDKIYLDQAATSYPKPETVYQSIEDFARETGIGGGRGNYSENRVVADLFSQVRELCGRLFNASPNNIIFTSGSTESLNTLLLGSLEPGDHVVISPFEHNSVLRPLQYLSERREVDYTILDGSIKTGISPESFEKSLRPQTKLCILNHISNSFGTVQPVAEIGNILAGREDVFYLLDAAQSAATEPIDVKEWNVDALCFSGHKGMLGPTGTGGFYIHPRMVEAVEPLKMGGTGSNGGIETYSQSLPKKFEVGTQNSWGIAGLKAGLEFVNRKGVSEISKHIDNLTELAVEKLSELEKIKLYIPEDDKHHGVVSLTTDFLPPRDSASLLDKLFSVKTRAGLHCSPEAHRIAGTYPGGTIRVSFGLLNTEQDVHVLSEALRDLEAETG